MRVVIVADSYPPDNTGGAARSALLIVEGLLRAGCEVLVITHGRSVGRTGRVLRIADGPGGFMLSLATRGWSAARDFRPDIVEFTGPVGPLMLAGAEILGGAIPPSVALVLGLVQEEMRTVRAHRIDGDLWLRPTASEWFFKFVKGPVMVALEQVRARWCGRVAAVSCRAADLWSRRYGVRDKMAVLYNGVDADFWKPAPQIGARIRQRYGLQDAEVVMFAGAFRAVKGFDILLKAMALVCRRRPKARLLIAGGGRGYEKQVQAIIDRLDLRERVRMLGWLSWSQLVEHYNAVDVVAVPSRQETFGLTAAEAMACGRCVVASSVGGLSEVISSQQVGRLVRPEDPEALAEAICQVLADRHLRDAIGAAARRHVCENFSMERMTQARLALYGQLVSSGSVQGI